MSRRALVAQVAMVGLVILAACGGGSSGGGSGEGGGSSDGGGSSGGTVGPPKTVLIAQTGQTVSKAAGDDASLHRGVEWPAPRFTSPDSGATVVDQLTGLMWAGSNTPVAECGWHFTDETKDVKTWQEALAYVACLNSKSYLGHADWRVPNRSEMRSLLENDDLVCNDDARLGWLQKQGFQFASTDPAKNLDLFVTSTAVPGARGCTEASGRRLVWIVNLCGATDRDIFTGRWMRGVWPVRDAEGVKGAAKLAATGLTACYDWTGCGRIDCAGTGQDGETQKGVAWPSPRFVVNPDTTVTDALTKLVWAPNGNLPNPDPAGTAAPMTWPGPLDVIDQLNAQAYLGQTDWRLPNINELETLALGDIETEIYTQLRAAGIQVKDGAYWSSTWGTIVTETSSEEAGVWVMSMISGRQSLLGVTDKAYGQVLPVRGGP